MDKKRSLFKSSEPHLSNSGDCIITLDSQQYYFYQSHNIQIHAPDGTCLDRIGYSIKSNQVQYSTARLKEQVFLVECLLGNIVRDLGLPRQIGASLQDLLDRMQSACEVY